MIILLYNSASYTAKDVVKALKSLFETIFSQFFLNETFVEIFLSSFKSKLIRNLQFNR